MNDDRNRMVAMAQSGPGFPVLTFRANNEKELKAICAALQSLIGRYNIQIILASSFDGAVMDAVRLVKMPVTLVLGSDTVERP